MLVHVAFPILLRVAPRPFTAAPPVQCSPELHKLGDPPTPMSISARRLRDLSRPQQVVDLVQAAIRQHCRLPGGQCVVLDRGH